VELFEQKASGKLPDFSEGSCGTLGEVFTKFGGMLPVQRGIPSDPTTTSPVEWKQSSHSTTSSSWTIVKNKN
jgi:hypothetical protein